MWANLGGNVSCAFVAVVVRFVVVLVGSLAVVLAVAGCSASGTVCKCSARCLSEMKGGEWSFPAGSVSPAESTNAENGQRE